jgi:hypothetical protein
VHLLAWLRPGGTASDLAMSSWVGFQMIFWWW